MASEEKSARIAQIQTDVNLISFLTVITVFFTGSLLPQFNSYDLSIKIPISFLIISTFGFLFSALILTNVISKIISEESDKVSKHLQWGYAISEYLGVYLFVLSIPLLVSIITSDFYLRIITFIAAIAGMWLYQFMEFSLLQTYFRKTHKLFSILTIFFGIVLFMSQIYHFHFTEVSIVFLLFILGTTLLAPVERFQ